MSDHSFVHLNVHSEYSIKDSTIRVKSLVESCASHGMSAVALTDFMNVCGMVRFYKACVSRGIKPILGVDALVQCGNEYAQVLFLCQNQQGYKQLSVWLTDAYLNPERENLPFIKTDWLGQSMEGLIAILPSENGPFSSSWQNDSLDGMYEKLNLWKKSFENRLYFSVARINKENEALFHEACFQVAEENQIPIVAVNNVRFIDKSGFEAHEARVCIHDGDTLNNERRVRKYTESEYFKSSEEMLELFKDLPEVIENSVELVKRCNFELTLDTNFLPQFPTPEGVSPSSLMKKVAIDGLAKRFRRGHIREGVDQNLYQARLEIELDVISGMDFPGYFLVVADFIRWAKDNGVPVGPGRGSGAGSLVAFAMGITDVDPLEFDLLFERFLNPERVSMPDFDIDFCMDGRDRVIRYVQEQYGKDAVAQIITFGTMAAKAVIRDVGRALGHPYGFVDRIAKLIPFELGMTLEKALEESEDLARLYHNDDEVNSLITLARELEGVIRNAGKHAGGVVIAPTVLSDFVPLYAEAGGTMPVTQLDKDDVEAIGLVKFDFLGLRTLTIIQWALDFINEERSLENKPAIDIAALPKNDRKTFELIQRADTTAVFQLESRGMKELISRLQPDCFEDVVALVALFRPGPLQSGMVDDFIDRKHGRQEVSYPHPELEPILKSTYGVILYQEQVMQIAQVLAGYTLGAADLLRRAMGKKKPEEMAKQRAIFTEGSVARGVDEKLAHTIFDLMEKFSAYGFNKSHSVAYALIAYQTAWLKAHYPAHFMAAVLSSDMDNTDKTVHFIEDCAGFKLKLLPPSVNESDFRFTVKDKSTIRYGLGAVKGVGENIIQQLVEHRKKDGPFLGFFELVERLSGKLNKKSLEALIDSGSLDGLGPSRATLYESISVAQKKAEKALQMKLSGQGDIFGGGSSTQDDTALFRRVEEWALPEILRREKATLGFYVSGHPLDPYRPLMKKLRFKTLREVKKSANQTVTTLALIHRVRMVKTKTGRRMGILTLDDGLSRMDATIFSDLFDEKRVILEADEIVVLKAKVTLDQFTGQMRLSVEEVSRWEDSIKDRAKQVEIHTEIDKLGSNWHQEYQRIILNHQGTIPVKLIMNIGDLSGDVWLSSQGCVEPNKELVGALTAVFGEDKVKVRYE